MARLQVFIETSAEALSEGGYLAHVPELPGCVARGKTKEQVITSIRATIDAYLTLRRKRGHGALPGDESVELDIVETEEMTFPPDCAPLDEQDLTELCEQAALSRQALIEFLKTVPAQALTWQPDRESWQLGNIVAHIASADLWYASRLQEGGLPTLLWRLDLGRSVLLRCLQELPSNMRGRVTTHNGETWTPRKVARRMLEHEQEHLDNLRELVAKYHDETTSP